jgi:hypothetical protein
VYCLSRSVDAEELESTYAALRGLLDEHDPVTAMTEAFGPTDDISLGDILEAGFERPRRCARCRKTFTQRVNLAEHTCPFHPGVLVNRQYTCCGGPSWRSGCARGVHLCEKRDVIPNTSVARFDSVRIPLKLLFFGAVSAWPSERVVEHLVLRYRKDAPNAIDISASEVVLPVALSRAASPQRPNL